MEVGTKISMNELKKHCFMDAKETMSQLYAGGKMKVWSWGLYNVNAFVTEKKECFALRFNVQGQHFTGHVYIVLNGMDLYDVYYCSNRGTIKMIDNDLYCDQLTDVIDSKVERKS
jgi:hypothetical protein